MRFPDQADRQEPRKADYQEIFVRLFKASPDGLTIDGLKERILLLGRCECGCKRSFGPSFDMQHLPPVWSLREGDEQKFYAWRSDCHLADSKTQNGKAAKAKRIGLGKTQFDKRKAAGGSRLQGRGFDKGKPKWGSQKMQSRGFDKRFKKKMNGEVVPR